LNFETRLASLDTSLFHAIGSQSTEGDRVSWLALQAAVRREKSPYTYLEIGSHLGGSIQQHLLDDRCGRIYSIDKRPDRVPDNRGFVQYGSSTEGMLEGLRSVSPGAVHKITCIDADASEVGLATIAVPPDFCFIDGMHTTRGVLSDFDFCRRVCAPSAVIGFHDADLIYPALVTILAKLRREGHPYEAMTLQGSTFALFLGGHLAAADQTVLGLAQQGGALQGLRRRWLVNAVRHFFARYLPTVLQGSRALRKKFARR
jgi:hypothetical protein